MATPLSANQRIYVTVRCRQGGQVCENFFPYASGSDLDPIFNAAGIAAAWIAEVLPTWQAITSEQLAFERLEIVGYGTVNIPSTIIFLNEIGDVVGDVLPPWVSYSFRKYPETEVVGIDTTPFRNGGWRVSGIPETWQDNGVIDSSHQAALDAAAVAPVVLNPTPVSGSGNLTMFMYRPAPAPGQPVSSAAFVDSAGIPLTLGSQNSRKYF